MKIAWREGEARVLRGLLMKAIAGEGNVAVVSGAAGMGKSSLLAALTDEAAQAGAVVLAASCSRDEAGLPFGILDQLVRCRQGEQALRNPWRQALVAAFGRERVSDIRELQADEHQGTQSVAMAMCTAVLELAERRPVVVLVDDIEFADEPSCMCLSYLVRRLRARSLLAVFSQDEISWRPPTKFQAELLRRPRRQLLLLTSLTMSDITEIISERLGEQAADELASSWQRISGGNPLLLQALLADYPEPEQAYSLAMLSCLDGQDFSVQQLAAGLAVLGDRSAEVRGADLARLVGIDAEIVESGLRSLSKVGLIGEDRRFRHPSTRSTILACLDSQLRAELHGRAAEIAFGAGLPAELVAQHLRASALAPGSLWAVPVLEEAARAAIDDGRIETAVDYLKLAEYTCPDDQHRAAIRTALIRAKWRIDPSIPAAALTELVGELDHGNVRGPDLVVLAKALLWHGRNDDARTVLRHLDRSISDGQESAAQTCGEIGAFLPLLRCTYPTVLAHCPVATHVNGPSPAATVLPRQEAAAALVQVLTRGPEARVMSAVERILRHSRLDDISMDAEECALLVLVFGGKLNEAACWYEALISHATASNATSRQARLAAIRAEIGLRQGDLAGAAAFGQLALNLMPASGWGVAIGAPLSVLAAAMTAMGHEDTAAEVMRRPVPEAMLHTRHGLQYLHARGRCLLAAGNTQAALADFQSAGELMLEWQLDSAVLLTWRLAAAEALLLAGQKTRARELIEEQLSRSAHMTARECGSATRLLAITEGMKARPGLLGEAAEMLRAAGDRYELCRTLAAMANAYQVLGEACRARNARKQALALAEECRATPLVRTLADAAERGRRPGERGVNAAESSLLSDTERRVADLAAIGYTNRDISEKLCITVSTVEQHLTRIYRKLNLSGRGELSASQIHSSVPLADRG